MQTIQQIKVLRTFQAIDELNDRGIVRVHVRSDLDFCDAAILELFLLERITGDFDARLRGDLSEDGFDPRIARRRI